MVGLKKTKVKLCKYKNKWVKLYQAEKEKLSQLLKNYDVVIEHVGSTSIPGLCAKPIIDIAVGVKNTEGLYVLLNVFENSNYDEIKNNIESSAEVLVARHKNKKTTHLIHVEVYESQRWNNHIIFRDYLKNNTEVLKEYQKLKMCLAKKFKNSRAEYTAAKDQFIKEILKRAQ